MNKQVLDIEIIGMRGDEEHVRLNDFINQLKAINTALVHTDYITTGWDSQSTYYRIKDLRHSSPANVTLEALPLSPDKDYTYDILKKFVDAIQQILATEEAPTDFDRHALLAFKGICAPLRKNISKLTISRNGDKVVVSPELSDKISKILQNEVSEHGSVTGDLDALYVHSNNVFYIYPYAGPKKITCHFPTKMLEGVTNAVKRFVNVSGTLKYKKKDLFPYAIEVESIEIYPEEKDLPTLWDMYGIEPNATGKLDSVEFVRTLRDA